LEGKKKGKAKIKDFDGFFGEDDDDDEMDLMDFDNFKPAPKKEKKKGGSQAG
jgi:hypothetical protein